MRPIQLILFFVGLYGEEKVYKSKNFLGKIPVLFRSLERIIVLFRTTCNIFPRKYTNSPHMDYSHGIPDKVLIFV